jgi:hypothetical protein
MPKEPTPIEIKKQILSELDMTDSEAVEAHLIKETQDITDPLKMEMRLDRVAHSMIMNFFDGDRQFVAKSNGNKKKRKKKSLNYIYPKEPYVYCKQKQCKLTIKQISEKGCLEKQCWHLYKSENFESMIFMKGTREEKHELIRIYKRSRMGSSKRNLQRKV